MSYALSITDIDPLKYDLLFERFLNPGRKSMPDIDMDFSVEHRGEVIDYVAQKYGRDRVAQIITFGTMAARAAVRDAARVMGKPYAVGDRIAKMIPEQAPPATFDDAMKQNGELKQAYDSDAEVREVVDLARSLEGLIRNDSIHAAAVVISDKPLTEYLPLQQKGEAELVTQFDMNDVSKLGLLKMDFLGLRNLDVIEAALGIIEKTRGVCIEIDKLPLDDEKTYKMLARGDSTGVFQFESAGMKEALREIGPTEFEDLIAIVALYRPGPMQFIPTYARNKKDPASVVYDHEALRPILEPTHGVTIYQEQYMAIARRVGGFSPAQADDLRKAISKKNKVLMASLKEPLMEGLAGQGRAAGGGQQDVVQLRGHRRLLVQQEPRRLLRDDQLPHRLAQGQLPGRVHGGPCQQRHEHQGQGAVLRQPVPRDGYRGAPAGRQHERRRVHRGGGQDPLRHERREGRRRGRHRGDHRRARGRRAVRVRLRLLRARRLADGQQARARGAHPRRARSTAPATRAAA